MSLDDFEFHPEAGAEFLADIDWFEEREFGLGERFAAAVRASIEDAVESPEGWSAWPGWNREPVVRSRGVKRFQYRVVCFVSGELVIVVAVAREKRRPGYWRDRMARG